MFLKRKRCGTMKGRGCADGRPQREYISKEESSSPTVSTHALMGQCLINAIEERKVATVDIPAAFLQQDWDHKEDYYIRFDGVMVDMLLKICPEYAPCVKVGQNGQKVIMTKLKKAIYGTLLAARIFYNKLRSFLQSDQFEINP